MTAGGVGDDGALLALAVAKFTSGLAQFAGADVALTCTVAVAPMTRLPKLHERTPLMMEHDKLSRVQLRPDGSVSESVTPAAVLAPMLCTTIVKPTASPALTLTASAVLVTRRDVVCARTANGASASPPSARNATRDARADITVRRLSAPADNRAGGGPDAGASERGPPGDDHAGGPDLRVGHAPPLDVEP